MHTKDIQALAAVALFYIVIESLGVTCPILFLTGISCAGCGMSRAWLSLLRLDLAGAFAFHPLFWLPVPAAALLLFRMFSRNLVRRRAENARFLAWWSPIRGRLAGMRQRSLDKEHKYFTCKSCKTICRVPAGKGKIEITCPKCGGKIIGKS